MSGRVCFGDFVLDPETRELCRGGDPIPLSPKAYQLLEILVANRPKALSKIALQERLWPDAFVVEKNLVNLIAEIRKALDDDRDTPALRAHRPPIRLRVSGADRMQRQGSARAFAGRRSASVSSGQGAVQAWVKASTCWAAIRTSSSSSTPGCLASPCAHQHRRKCGDTRGSRQQEWNVRRRSASRPRTALGR